MVVTSGINPLPLITKQLSFFISFSRSIKGFIRINFAGDEESRRHENTGCKACPKVTSKDLDEGALLLLPEALRPEMVMTLLISDGEGQGES